MTDKQYPELPEPDSYVFQHEETGQSQFIDRQQVEWGFEKNNPRLHRVGEAFTVEQMRAYVDADRVMRAAEAVPAITAGDAVFAFASMLTALPHVVPFGSCAWATPGAELASAFNAANGLDVSRDFPTGLVFPKIEGVLLACIEEASQQNTVVAPTARAAPQSAAPASQEAIDDAAVDALVVKMKSKLARKRAEGRGGWETCSQEYLSRLLRMHVDKGDPIDVANFCAFLAARGEGIAPVAQGDALDQGVREELSIGKAINRAARDLPEGWEIRIDLERGAGVVHLTDPEGNETMSEGGELFSDQINAAIDAARGVVRHAKIWTPKEVKL